MLAEADTASDDGCEVGWGGTLGADLVAPREARPELAVREGSLVLSEIVDKAGECDGRSLVPISPGSRDIRCARRDSEDGRSGAAFIEDELRDSWEIGAI